MLIVAQQQFIAATTQRVKVSNNLTDQVTGLRTKTIELALTYDVLASSFETAPRRQEAGRTFSRLIREYRADASTLSREALTQPERVGGRAEAARLSALLESTNREAESYLRQMADSVPGPGAVPIQARALKSHVLSAGFELDAYARKAREYSTRSTLAAGTTATHSLLVVLCLIAIAGGIGSWLVGRRFRLIAVEAERERNVAVQRNAELMGLKSALESQNDLLRCRTEELEQASLLAHESASLHEIAAGRFQELFQGLPLPCFTFDLQGTLYEWNALGAELLAREGFALYGQPIDSAIDLDDGHEKTANLLERLSAGGRVQNEEWTIRAQGETRHFLLSAFPLRAQGGSVRAGLATLIDVTERIAVERALSQSEALFRAALEALPSGLMVCDQNLHPKIMNPQAGSIVGGLVETGRAVDLTWIQPLGIKLPRAMDPLIRARFSQGPRDELLGIADAESGSTRWFNVSASKIDGPDDSVCTLVLSFAEVTRERQLLAKVQSAMEALEAANERLDALARRDGLTGLFNFRTFQEMLDQELAQARRLGQPISLALLDVDFFKKFNDEFGHPAGDDVLRGVAECLRTVARESDFVARYGGEEFVAVLVGANESEAIAAAERFREAIEKYAWPFRPITASIGVATLKGHRMQKSDLIAQADRALYASKEQGRNLVTHISQLESVEAA